MRRLKDWERSIVRKKVEESWPMWSQTPPPRYYLHNGENVIHLRVTGVWAPLVPRLTEDMVLALEAFESWANGKEVVGLEIRRKI